MSTTALRPAEPFAAAPPPRETPIRVERWPSERPLFAVTLVVAVALWIALAVSIVGLFYALFLGLFFFVMRLGFIAHLRGSAVRLGPAQFPELHERVGQLARRMGLDPVPEAYLMQAGGALNAFATRFAGAHLVVLHAELLDACGDDEAARDMIIAHELGHVHAGHLRWHTLLLPAAFVPFLGTALSRAREYTCDRYGRAGAGSVEGAVRGLVLLAAGPRHAGRVNLQAFVRQRADLNTTWMTLGEWLSTHPPLAKRVAQVDPRLATEPVGTGGAARAAAVLACILAPLLSLGWLSARFVGDLAEKARQEAPRAALTDDAAAPR